MAYYTDLTHMEQKNNTMYKLINNPNKQCSDDTYPSHVSPPITLNYMTPNTQKLQQSTNNQIEYPDKSLWYGDIIDITPWLTRTRTRTRTHTRTHTIGQNINGTSANENYYKVTHVHDSYNTL